MLKEIYCDKFVVNGEIRKPIKFHTGLNTVLGSKSAKNSIGKTTFLLIIDFCFGGMDYVNLNSDINDIIGPHTIYFKFEFGKEEYFFARDISKSHSVQVCDDKRNVLSTMSIDSFREFLFDKYQLLGRGNSFRDIVNGYFRIYGKDNATERYPLKAHGNDTMEKGIRRLMLLYGVYGKLADLEKELSEAEELENTYKNGHKHKLIKGVKSKKEYEKNNEKIDELETRRSLLVEKSSSDLLDVDSAQASRLAELKRKLATSNRQKRRFESRLAAMQKDMDYGDPKFKRNFDELLEYFPKINIRRIEDIDNFHKSIKKVLSQEQKENKKTIETLIKAIDQEISEIENDIKGLNRISIVSAAVLEEYAEIEKELADLRDANKYYEEINVLRDKIKDLGARYNKSVVDAMEEAQRNINIELKKYNSIVCSAKTSSPCLKIKDSKSYSYRLPKDTGTGSQMRGMLLLDYVMLKNTPLPAIIEDSMTIKQIEDSATIKLFELFNESDKQVFITIDKGESYSDNNTLPKVLEETRVLELSEGKELFGKSWNIAED